MARYFIRSASAVSVLALFALTGETIADPVGINTGTFLTAGNTFWVKPDLTFTSTINEFTVNADGLTTDGTPIAPQEFVTNSSGNGSFSDYVGAMYGQIGNGDYFHVGTSYEGYIPNSGELMLFVMGTDYTGWGSVHYAETIAPTPIDEPTNMWLIGTALGAFGISRLRRKAKVEDKA